MRPDTLATALPLSAGSEWWTVVPGSISALVAAAALVVTLLLYSRGSRDRVRAQAHLVYALQEVSKEVGGKIYIKVAVRNGSDQPIWEVDVQPLRARTLQLADQSARYAVIRPDKEEIFELSVDLRGESATPGSPHSLDRTPSVSFVDYAGHHWTKIGADLRLTRDRNPNPMMASRILARVTHTRERADDTKNAA